MINNNSNNKNNIKNIEDNEKNNKNENNKKIMKSIQLLIGTLSINGLKEIQSEVKKMLSEFKK